MALTDATRLADFSSGVGTDGTLQIILMPLVLSLLLLLKLVVRSLFLVVLLLQLNLLVMVQLTGVSGFALHSPVIPQVY